MCPCVWILCLCWWVAVGACVSGMLAASFLCQKPSVLPVCLHDLACPCVPMAACVSTSGLEALGVSPRVSR